MKLNSDASSTGDPAADLYEGHRQPGATAQLLLWALVAYKRLVSPHFAGSCRFLPSCADYAREAVIRHGAVRGSWLAARRLARCHPLCAAGFDPVPPTNDDRGPCVERGAGWFGLTRRIARGNR